MTRGSAAQRFALALARHLHEGGGVSERSVTVLAGLVGVTLADAATPSGERPTDPTVMVGAPCHRCGRSLSRPIYVGNFAYGPKCVRRIGHYLARAPFTARNAGVSP